MDLDIQTEGVLMRPEWHRIIDDWLARCTQAHPELTAVEVSLRHVDRDRSPEEAAEVIANARGRRFRETRRGSVMASALHDAFEAMESDLELG
jgi:ribosome-associated translation inhibitor RaiA